MNSRTVIFSDTHLGAPGRGAGSAEALRPLWRGAGTVILNGDAAELADPTWRVASARHVLRIQELCEQDGVELRFLSGNHDPLIDDRRFLSLYGGQVFVTHGDMLHPAISPWTSHAAQLLELHQRALASLAPAELHDLSARLAAVQHSALMKWEDLAVHPHRARATALPAKALRVAWYWMTMHRRAADFAAEFAPDARYFIFGHYHRAGVWQVGGRTIINTGCFNRFMRPRAVVLEDSGLHVFGIQRRKDAFHLARKPAASFALHT